MAVPMSVIMRSMDSANCIHLFKWVLQLRNGQQLSLRTQDIKDVLFHEFQVPLSCLSPGLVEVLPPMLVVFMLKWPKWHLITDKKFELIFVVDKLRTYLKEKLDYLIRKQYRDHVGEPETAPFTLSVTCPPKMLNSLFFVGTEDNIVAKAHGGTSWVDLTPSQLIHWPFVDVYFKSPELSFSRKMDMTYSRFLSDGPVSYKHQKTDITNMHLDKPSLSELRHSLVLLESYIKAYLEVIILTNDLSTAKFEEISSILKHIVLDFKLCQYRNFVQGNREFVVQLGSDHNYSRVKKKQQGPQTDDLVETENLVQTEKPAQTEKPSQTEKPAQTDDPYRMNSVRYWEFLYPKVKFCLENFTAKPERANEINFVSLNKMKFSAQSSEILPKITYKCTFCNKSLESRNLAVKHFRDCHKMEPDLYCEKCRKTLKMAPLAGDRYVHECSKSKN